MASLVIVTVALSSSTVGVVIDVAHRERRAQDANHGRVANSFGRERSLVPDHVVDVSTCEVLDASREV